MTATIARNKICFTFFVVFSIFFCEAATACLPAVLLPFYPPASAFRLSHCRRRRCLCRCHAFTVKSTPFRKLKVPSKAFALLPQPQLLLQLLPGSTAFILTVFTIIRCSLSARWLAGGSPTVSLSCSLPPRPLSFLHMCRAIIPAAPSRFHSPPPTHSHFSYYLSLSEIAAL